MNEETRLALEFEQEHKQLRQARTAETALPVFSNDRYCVADQLAAELNLSRAAVRNS